MTSISGKQFAKLLEKHGWRLLRVNGSHHIYGKLASMLGCPYRYMATKP